MSEDGGERGEGGEREDGMRGGEKSFREKSRRRGEVGCKEIRGFGRYGEQKVEKDEGVER